MDQKDRRFWVITGAIVVPLAAGIAALAFCRLCKKPIPWILRNKKWKYSCTNS